MEINIRDDKKIFEIWLSGAEKSDPAISDALRPLFAEYKPRKYTVAVFESGAEDLPDLTAALLLYNRKKQAERETQQARTPSGPAMTMKL